MNEKQFLECCDIQVKRYVEKFNNINNINYVIGNGFKLKNEGTKPPSFSIRYVASYKEITNMTIYLKFTHPDNMEVRYEPDVYNSDFLKINGIFIEYMDNIPFGNFKECLNLLKKDNQGSNFKPRE